MCLPHSARSSRRKGKLAELDKQGFDGYYVIEYEANWNNNIPEIGECADFLRKN